MPVYHSFLFKPATDTHFDFIPLQILNINYLLFCYYYTFVRIEKIVILTLLPLGEHVPKTEAQCFELYGFDILLDDILRPWLIEVNFSPSLGGDSTTDQTVKEGLIEDVIDTLDFRPPVAIEEMTSTQAEMNGSGQTELLPLEKSTEYVQEYDRFLSRIPATHRTQASENGGVGNFDIIFPFNEETTDASQLYASREDIEVQQKRIVDEVAKKFGKFKSPIGSL